MSEDGDIVMEAARLNTGREMGKLAKEIKRFGDCSAVCESTANLWIKTFEAFEEEGIPIVLANPFKTRAIAEARVKTDKLDARVLAHLLRADLVAECRVPDAVVRDKKEVLRHRITLVQERTRVSNRLHSLLDKYDIKVGPGHIAGTKSLRKLSELEIPREHDDFVAHQHVGRIRQITDDVKEIEKRIDSLASENEDAKLLMSMTGLDAFGALLIALEIDGIERFSEPPKLVSWMGLCPTVYQSGNTMRHGRMRKDTNRRVNWMMIQAAHTAARYDDRLRVVYEKARKRHPPGVAITHVACKMATIIWHMLQNGEPYEQRNAARYERKLKRIGCE